MVRFGSMTPFGLGRAPGRELQDRQAVGVVARPVEVRRRRAPGPAGQVEERDHRRVARLRLDERRQVGVDDEQRDVGGDEAGPGLAGELLDGAEPHRQRQHDERGAGEPHGLDGGDERPGGRARAGRRGRRAPTPRAWRAAAIAWASSRKRAPGDDVLAAARDEGEVPGTGAAGGLLDALGEGEGSSRHHGLRPRPLRSRYEPASKPSRTTATPSSAAVGRDPVGGGLHVRRGVAHGDGRAGPLEHRHVVPLVAQGHDLGGRRRPSRSADHRQPGGLRHARRRTISTHSPAPAVGRRRRRRGRRRRAAPPGPSLAQPVPPGDELDRHPSSTSGTRSLGASGRRR